MFCFKGSTQSKSRNEGEYDSIIYSCAYCAQDFYTTHVIAVTEACRLIRSMQIQICLAFD